MSIRIRDNLKKGLTIAQLRNVEADHADASLGKAKAKVVEATALRLEGERTLEALEASWRRHLALPRLDVSISQLAAQAVLNAASDLQALATNQQNATKKEKDAIEHRRLCLARQQAAAILVKARRRRLHAATDENRLREIEDRTTHKGVRR
jgi:hypothetical protein